MIRDNYSNHPSSPRGARRPARALLTCFTLGLLLLAVQSRPATARQSQPARLGIRLAPLTEVGYDYGVYLQVKVSNTLDESQPQRGFSLGLTRYIHKGGRLITIRGGEKLGLNAFAGDDTGVGLIGRDGSSIGDLTIRNLSWPGGEEGTVSFEQGESTLHVVVENLPLPASEYRVVVVKGGADSPLVDTVKKLKAGERHTVDARRPGLFESLKDGLLNKQSLLVAIIIGLSGILVTVLKDKIKDGANWLLDTLGKYGRGRLARRRFLRRYLTVLVYNHKYLRLIGFNTSGIRSPLLEEVFVSLRITGQAADHYGPPAARRDDGGGARASISFATALRQYRKLVILGGPGAGKTTTLSYALLAFAQGKGWERLGIREDYLPIFVPLRRLSDGTRSLLDDVLDEKTQILPPEVLKEHPAGYFERELKAGRCIVLLDGLDEVVDEGAHRRVAAKINDMAAAYPDNRYVVTCRVSGWKALLSGEFDVLQTQDFNREEIQRFVYGWHRAVITRSEYDRMELQFPDRKKFEAEWANHNEGKVKPAIEIQTKNLLRAVDSSNRILAIAVNPMLLSLISLVHFVRHILPRGRTILYSQCIELLIDAWERSKEITWHQASQISPQMKEALLREIAFEFQRNGVGEFHRGGLEKFIGQTAGRLGIGMSPGELLEQIEQRSGLLIERSIDVFGFSHLTLQEYLVAKHLQLNPAYRGLILKNVDKQEWREVTLLYAGLLDDATELVAGIAGGEGRGRILLAGHCIGDAQFCDASVSGRVISELMRWLKDGEDDGQVVEALGAIAADYDGRPNRLEEKLSEELIELVGREGAPSRLRADCMGVLARAKVTKAIPSLVRLLAHPDFDVSGVASAALVAFGNLALLELERVFVTIASYEGWREAARILMAGRDVEPVMGDTTVLGPAYFNGVERCIRVCRDINTAASAKLLLKLPIVAEIAGRAYLQQAADLAVAQMLANPFIESDLQQVEFHQLDWRLIKHPDGGGWAYGALPANSSFPRLDAALREKILEAIRQTDNYPASAEGEDLILQLNACSFKLLYPALLEDIRRGGGPAKADIADDPTAIPAYLSQFGFERDGNEGQLAYLFNQIRSNPTMTLEYALSSRHRYEGLEEGRKEGLLKRAGRYAAVGIMGVLSVIQILFMGILIGSLSDDFELYRSTGDFLSANGARLTVLFLPLSLHLSVLILSSVKLRRSLRPKQYLFVALVPYVYFLKVLPYLTRLRLWLKSLIYHAALSLFSSPGAALLVEVYMSLSGSWRISTPQVIVLLAFMSSLVAASLYYLRYSVLVQNPIYQLLLLHPEGRRAVGVQAKR